MTCPAAGQCQAAGVCSPLTGNCNYAPLAGGTACNDGDACTTEEACGTGLCVGGPPPADMDCFTVRSVNLKLSPPPRGKPRGGDHDDDSDSDAGFDEGGNHAHVRGTYRLNDCTRFDPAQGASVTLDGRTFVVPAGGFRPIGHSGRYRYSWSQRGHGSWVLVIDTRKNEWTFHAHHFDAAGIAPADGLTVRLQLGVQVGEETVALRGHRGGLWQFRAPHQARHCPPPRPDHDGDSDHDSDRDSDRDSDHDSDRDSDRDSDHRR